MSLKPLSRIPLTRPGSASGSGPTDGGRGGFGRKYTLSVSFAGLLAGSVILLIAFGWVFAFGVIVGRGYDPEQKLSRFARMLPTPDEPAAGQPAADNPDAGILKAEELTFMRDLRQRPGESAVPPNAVPAAPAAPGVSTPAPRPADPAGTDSGSVSSPAAVPGSRAGGEVGRPAAPASADQAKYDFLFQVAAFKNSGQADSLRERLEGEGLRTKMTIEKDNKGKPRWYRVQVLLRGSEADAAAAGQTLARVGLKDARVISKTSVGRGR